MSIFSCDAVNASRVCKQWHKVYKDAVDLRKSNLITRLFVETWVDNRLNSITDAVYLLLGSKQYVEKACQLGGVPPVELQFQAFLPDVRTWIFNEEAPYGLMHIVNHLIDSEQFEILFAFTSKIPGFTGIRYVQYQLIQKRGYEFALQMIIDFQPRRLDDHYKAFIGICGLNLGKLKTDALLMFKSVSLSKEVIDQLQPVLLYRYTAKPLSSKVINDLQTLILAMYPTIEALKTSQAESLLQLIKKYSFVNRIPKLSVKSILMSTWKGLGLKTSVDRGLAAIKAIKEISQVKLRRELIRLTIYQRWSFEQFTTLWPYYLQEKKECGGIDYATLKLIWFFSQNEKKFLQDMYDFSKQQPLFLQAVRDVFLESEKRIADIFLENKNWVYKTVFRFLESNQK